MGLAKRILERTDDYYKIALEAMIATGAIKTCDIHTDFFYQTYALENDDEIYKRATKYMKDKYGEQNDYKMFHAQVDRILKDAGTGPSECSQCKKIEEE